MTKDKFDMMKEPLIKRAVTNQSKGKTYTRLLGKYKAAMENGYYGEAELTVYAYMEDRLRAFIYYSDLIDSFNSNRINENAESINGGELDIRNISGKIQIIRKAIKVCSMKVADMSTFQEDLWRRYKVSIKAGELKAQLNQVEKWCRYRNEIVHAMFNKDLEDLRQGYRHHVEEGMKLARFIDAQVDSLKNA